MADVKHGLEVLKQRSEAGARPCIGVVKFTSAKDEAAKQPNSGADEDQDGDKVTGPCRC